MKTDFTIITAQQDFDLLKIARSHINENWPEFMLNDPVANNFPTCYEKLPQFQFVLFDESAGKVAAIGNSIPLSWNDDSENLPEEGWDWAMTQGIADLGKGTVTKTLSALQVVVFKDYRGQGISTLAVEYMRTLARKNGFARLIAPVRPSGCDLSQYKSFEDYVYLKKDDGWPLDPWLRVHCRLGGKIIKICHRSMKITAPVADWERWGGMSCQRSGDYTINHALNTIHIDLDKNIGTYLEPNVWVVHSL